jgi:exopolysaccharide biosynthesis polyprenyl glycosylphosphotransferase
MSLAKLDLPRPRAAAEEGAQTEQTEQTEQRAWARLLPAGAALGLAVGDSGVVLGAFLLGHWLRFVAPGDEASALGLGEYAAIGSWVALVGAALFALHGFYDPDRPRAWAARLNLVVSSVSTALVLCLAGSYFVRGDQSFSRLWFAESWVLAIVGLSAWRPLAQRLYAAARVRLAPATRVLIVGANELGQSLARELAAGCQVVGFVDNGADTSLDWPLLGEIARLEHLVQVHAVDELVIALPAARREQVSRILARGFHREVHVKLVPELSELLPQRVEVQQLGGRSYIGFPTAARVSWIKRVVDLAVSSVGLLALLIPFALIGLAIKLDSPGPVLYGQLRVGKNGRPFRMLKFRSMYRDADRRLAELRDRNEASGPMFKMRHDPRVTRVGRVLRRLSLDELPQLVNVLRGEMSLVGPRPPIPSEVDRYEDWQHGRLRARPGITGLWQVSGRSEVPFHDMVRLDLHYIRNWSLGLDVEILARTIPAVLTSRGAF